MNILAIIPARYASTRFPGKPLIDIAGKSMIQRVYEQALKAFEHVYVATDDDRIQQHVTSLGYRVVMTSNYHRSGTDRCKEALQIIEAIEQKSFEIVVNVQGDEPFILPEQLKQVLIPFENKSTHIATLVKKIESFDELNDPNKPKVVINNKNEAIYFSRSVIPYLRGVEPQKWHKNHCYYKHIGLYAYRSDILNEITLLPQSSLELAESLEQLRWIENGYKISVIETTFETLSIDTPDDLKKIKV